LAVGVAPVRREKIPIDRNYTLHIVYSV
jgi:hypothetical protein